MTSRAAVRYAQAILDACPQDLALATLLQDMEDLRTSVKASRELLLFFASPIIPRGRKRHAVEALFKGRVSSYTMDVLFLLLEKNREDILLDIIDAVFTLYRQREGILSSHIVSAIQLTDEQKKRLTDALRQVSGKRIEAEYNVDADILAGVVVRLDDIVFDGSARRQLQRLHERFIGAS
jgi:F-type H+-transporting ATPase subunit delta